MYGSWRQRPTLQHEEGPWPEFAWPPPHRLVGLGPTGAIIFVIVQAGTVTRAFGSHDYGMCLVFGLWVRLSLEHGLIDVVAMDSVPRSFKSP